MNKVKAYTASPTDMSPPVDDKSFCVDFVLATDYQALQSERDHLAAQLADVVAENAALRKYRPQPNGAAMMEALDAFYEYHKDVPEQGMMAAFEILCCKRPQTPATDRFLAEQRAQGIEQWIASRNGAWNGTTKEAEKFADQLRNEVKG